MGRSSHSDDTVDLPKVESDDDGNKKKCCQCGKDLRGHRRFKDSVGYWCKDCHRVDKARNTVPEGRCPDCGRMRPLDKLYQTDDGSQVCSECLKERKKQAEKYAVKYEADKVEKWQERSKTLILLGVLGLLAVIVLVRFVMGLFAE
jgi:NMD protein affecting ribosome stability and mRNA decay